MITKTFICCICFLAASINTTFSQVKIGDNPETINANSILELESASKGFLAPRLAINDLGSSAPLTATVSEGMLVYSIGGSVDDGFYNWDGSRWVKLLNNYDIRNLTTKTANSTLIKTEKFVLASNDITITLPLVTSADNGIAITIKNVGTFTDLVTIVGNGGATLDEEPNFKLCRWQSNSFIAYEGNWLIKEKTPRIQNILDVSSKSSWNAIDEVLAFLNEHMEGPMVIRLCGEVFPISSTQVIDLPYSVTFQGLSYGTTTITAAAGLESKPMFRCLSECYFKMIMFDATSLINYGTLAGEDCIRLVGAGTYNEIKDCTFDGFYNTILDSTDAELWLFECDISNSHNNGVLLHSLTSGVKLRVSETDFISCIVGINLEKGSNSIIQLTSGAYLNTNATDVGINYNPTDFSFETLIITNNSWNNIGYYIAGFDFTRPDGRDADAFIISNAGIENKTPFCKINVNNNIATTTITASGTYYKANWTNGPTSYACKWNLADNKITYQPENGLGAWAIITGNISVSNANRVITIAIVKNGLTTTRYGETDLRVTVANQPFQFSTVIYIPDINKNDFLELFSTSSNNGDVVKFQDIQWFTNTQ